MGKLNQLLGIANNLADSFVSGINADFLHEIASLKIDTLEINLLNNDHIKKLKSNNSSLVLLHYRNWFNAEIKKLKIEASEIDSAWIRFTYKPGKNFGSYYTCNVTITAKGKEYVKKVMSSFA